MRLSALLTRIAQLPGLAAGPPAASSKRPDDGVGRRQQQQQQQQQVLSGPAGLPGPRLRPPGLVAFGDSYSAGIGTGAVDGEDDDCRRGTHAHPALIAADRAALAAGGPNAAAPFQWLSCTGATVEDVLAGGAHSQIDAFNASLLSGPGPGGPGGSALLSVGGNDLGFFDVINACVFRFYSFYSGTCEAALLRADALLASPAFEDRLRVALLEVLDRARWERRPGFAVTVTGYARFFDAESPECDGYSLGVWWGGPRLTRAVRRRLNGLVAAANARVRRAVAEVAARFPPPGGGGGGGGGGGAPRVVFADYDAAFEGHRFCEPGVAEPAYNRTDTWFFLVGGPDNAHNESQWPPPELPPDATTTAAATATPAGAAAPPGGARPPAAAVLSPLDPRVDPDACLARAGRSGDWGELAVCYMAMARRRDPSLRPARDGVLAPNSMWYVPTYYGKVFHPRSLGHEAIRDRIYEVWKEQGIQG